ncbi:MAG TPA: DUF389 domain-containing protein, partial [Halococcus sp.]|nr:DUF389 domain-containing protein [Halococcus sp.]
ISDLESATTPNIEELEEQYQEKPGGSHISHTGLRTATQELRADTATYIALVCLSAMVASVGLLLNSGVVIVGAMVISPFVGAILSASVGVVIDDREVVIDSLVYQAGGLVLAIASAVAIGFVFRWVSLVPSGLVIGSIGQIGAFSTPAALTIALAFFAGAASALTLASDLGTAVAGAAVAAAIVPAAAAVGIAIVWMQPAIALGAFVLLIANMLFLNFTSYVTFRALGYKPAVIDSMRQELRFDTHTTGYVLAIFVIAVLLVLTASGVYQYVLFQQSVNQQVGDVLDKPTYDEFDIADIETSYGGVYFLDQPTTVTVTLFHPARTGTPRLAPVFRRHIAAHTDWEVSVEVRFLEYQIASPPTHHSKRHSRPTHRDRYTIAN